MSIRAPQSPRAHKHFTPFYSAAEEAAAKMERESWDHGVGQLTSTRARLVRTPDGDEPYKVMLIHNGSAETAHAFATMRDAEAFIRANAA